MITAPDILNIQTTSRFAGITTDFCSNYEVWISEENNNWKFLFSDKMYRNLVEEFQAQFKTWRSYFYYGALIKRN